MRFSKTQSFIALLFLALASVLGIVLRLFPIMDIEATYRFIVHTHSHIALIGWVYVALTSLIYHIGIEPTKKKKYTSIFWCTQLTIVGMLATFPFIGYALYSILFSTLFILCSYWFYYFFKKNHLFNKEQISYKFIATSLLFMVISSIGPWSLGMIMNTLGNTSHWYKNAIYFYLHFQYNGWFVLCLIGVFYFILEKNKIKFSLKIATQFYKLMIVSCVLTLALSFLWSLPLLMMYLAAISGALLQLIAFYLFYKQLILIPLKSQFNTTELKALKFVFSLFFIKIILQALTAIPYFSILVAINLDFVIGYLHLTFLGITTVAILIFLRYFKMIQFPKIWLNVYLIGFILSELLIFYKGFCNWQQLSILDNYFTILVCCSSLMPIGILGIFFKNVKPTFSTLQESL